MPLDGVRHQSTEDLRWVAPGRISPIAEGELHVWLLHIGLANVFAPSCLSADECRRADAFKFERHRHEFTLCRSTLRRLLAVYLDAAPGDIDIVSSAGGKPHLSGSGRGSLFFNVSHSGEYALIAFGSDEVGVDIEIREASFIDHGTLDICLSPNERMIFDRVGQERQSELFFNTWTAKEAYLKLIGDGLAVEPDTIDLSAMECGEPTAISGDTVIFCPVPRIPYYSAAVATHQTPDATHFYAFDPGLLNH